MQLRNILLAALLLWGASACGNDDEKPTFGEAATYDMTGFARGADVSWLTEMEDSGVKFYDADGRATECLTLLRSLGMNSVRLRVWVNPEEGWCNKHDVVAKAYRAAQLGYRVMIDFHYSDTWADPGSQYKPAAWEGLSLDELKDAIATHTKDVLQALVDVGVTPEWVQVGNEVGPGMLWDTDASISGATYDITANGNTYYTNQENFAAFIQTGYDAVKAVCSDAKVIVHLHNGYDNDLYRWIFDILATYNTDYDVIGMSLYPTADTWESLTTSCISNVEDMISRYGKEVIIAEVGFEYDDPDTAKSFLSSLITQAKAIDDCLGVFYWEPECYDGWNSYTKGAFDDEGKPTAALDAFAADE